MGGSPVEVCFYASFSPDNSQIVPCWWYLVVLAISSEGGAVNERGL